MPPLSTKNLEIIKTALSTDVAWQRANTDLSKPEFVEYLKDTEKLLAAVRAKLRELQIEGGR